MTHIKEDQVVEIKYTLKNEEGDVLDSSEQSGPLTFTQGQESILPSLEAEMLGKTPGDVFDVVIAPEDAYGAYNESMVRAVPKSYFGPSVSEIRVGSILQIEAQSGQPVMMKAVEVQEDAIVLDANHPMAGQTLHFNIEILSVRDAIEGEESCTLESTGSCGCC